jgi:hypothetical protein
VKNIPYQRQSNEEELAQTFPLLACTGKKLYQGSGFLPNIPFYGRLADAGD